MIQALSASILIPLGILAVSLARLGLCASRRKMVRAGAFLAVLLSLGTGALLGGPSSKDGLDTALAHLSRRLREDPSPENYQGLADFAAEYAESELSAQAEFVLGMADFEAQRWHRASVRFEAARASRWLRDYATFYLARAAAEQQAFEAAERTLKEFSYNGSPLEEAVRVLEAELLLRANEGHKAVDWLKRQPDLWHRPALLLALAKAQRSVGQALAAAETLQRIYYEFPLSPEAEASNELLVQLRSGELSGRYPAPSEALRRARAERLWAAEAYRGARSAYVDMSVRSTEPTRTEARLRAALALYRLGSPRAACDELRAIPRVTPALEAEFRSYRVRCRLRVGDYSAVNDELLYLQRHYPTTASYEAGLLAAAQTTLIHGETRRARDYYRRLLEAFPRGPHASEAHWKLAWLAYRAGEASTAAQLMEEQLERYPDSAFLPRALYWRARLALSAGEEPLAERLLALLQERYPREYLAQQAERLWPRLQGAAASDGTAFPAWLERLSKSRPGWPARGSRAGASRVGDLPPALRALTEKALVLERLSLWELASQVLEAARRQLAHPDIHLAQARIALAQQQYAQATEILRRAYPDYWASGLEEIPRNAWEIMFLRPYWDLIKREARRQRLDPYLVAGLIRQESRFQADARSPAGALGLMQLMPATARSLARRRRLPSSRIVDPELNIRLGTEFLARLLQRFDGGLEKAVAAYNAGGSRVEEWLGQGPYREPAEFVESIPVTQTREFVYIVLRNYRFYRDLYAERD